MLDAGIVPCIVTKDAEGNNRLMQRNVFVLCNESYVTLFTGNRVAPISNVIRSKHYYYACVMEAEGLTDAHDESRTIFMYIFYGKFITDSGCQADIIRVIHKSMQQYTYR